MYFTACFHLYPRFSLQCVIDANIFPLLIDIMGKAEFKTRKEAAWAITNAASGGSSEQIHYLVNLGCIPPLCDLLTVMDSKIVQVALNGLEHILRIGEQDSKQTGQTNLYSVLIEECYGETLRSNEKFLIFENLKINLILPSNCQYFVIKSIEIWKVRALPRIFPW